MEGVGGIFQSIVSLNTESFDIYLDAFDEHQSFRYQNLQDAEITQTITSLLTAKDTRLTGLKLLLSLLDQLPSQGLLDSKASLWSSLALKACRVHELQAFSALSKLAAFAKRSPEFSKSFVNNHLPKIYESLSRASQTSLLPALDCVEKCLRIFPGSSDPAVGAVLVRFIDCSDKEIARRCGKCLHLLQQTRGGGTQGISHKMQWRNYQIKLLGSLNELFDQLFANCPDSWSSNPLDRQLLNVPPLELSHEPVQRTIQLYIRLRNLLDFFVIALREPFPVHKTILPRKILSLINRGLSMTCIHLQRNAISDNLALGALLPKIHLHLLQLLQSLLLTLRGHLRLHYHLILNLLIDVLKSTSETAGGCKKYLLNLRGKAFETIGLWCSITNSGSRCETVAEVLIMEIIKDIVPFQNEITLQVLHGAGKHMSKKARRHLSKALNEKSGLAQAYSNDSNYKRDNFSKQNNQKLCVAALCCLQEILKSCANLIQPTILKIIQTKIIEICGSLYSFHINSQQLYFDWESRLEVYRTLHLLILMPQSASPPPAQIAFNLFQSAHQRDACANVRRKCCEILLSLEKIIHPQKEGLLFPIDINDVRKAFSKFGKEYTIEESFLPGVLGHGYSEDQTDVQTENATNTNIASAHDKSNTVNAADTEITNGCVQETINDSFEIKTSDETSSDKSVDSNFNRNTEIVEEDILAAPAMKKQKLQDALDNIPDTKVEKVAAQPDDDLLLAEFDFVDELN